MQLQEGVDVHRGREVAVAFLAAQVTAAVGWRKGTHMTEAIAVQGPEVVEAVEGFVVKHRAWHLGSSENYLPSQKDCAVTSLVP